MKSLTDLSDEALARLARRAERELPDAPPWLVASAVAMWTPRSPVPPLGRRVLAVLGFDGWASQALPALRSSPSSARQLLFSAQERDIDLRVSASDPGRPPARFAIAGQVLGPGEGGAVSLDLAGKTIGGVALDEFGEFRFADLAAGAYVVTVRFGDEEIVLPEIDVGAEPPA